MARRSRFGDGPQSGHTVYRSSLSGAPKKKRPKKGRNSGTLTREQYYDRLGRAVPVSGTTGLALEDQPYPRVSLEDWP